MHTTNSTKLAAHLQPVTLHMAGGEYHYLYDAQTDQVYTALFPGIAVEQFHLPCGTAVPPEALRMVVKDKLRLQSEYSTSF